MTPAPYTDEAMQQAIIDARKATQWPDDASLYDMAGQLLAGPDADQRDVDAASLQVALMMDRG